MFHVLNTYRIAFSRQNFDPKDCPSRQRPTKFMRVVRCCYSLIWFVKYQSRPRSRTNIMAGDWWSLKI